MILGTPPPEFHHEKVPRLAANWSCERHGNTKFSEKEIPPILASPLLKTGLPFGFEIKDCGPGMVHGGNWMGAMSLAHGHWRNRGVDTQDRRPLRKLPRDSGLFPKGFSRVGAMAEIT
jgi:hypothetical protein